MCVCFSGLMPLYGFRQVHKHLTVRDFLLLLTKWPRLLNLQDGHWNCAVSVSIYSVTIRVSGSGIVVKITFTVCDCIVQVPKNFKQGVTVEQTRLQK